MLHLSTPLPATATLRSSRCRRTVALLTALGSAACLSSPTSFDGLLRAKDTGGPRVVFDLAQRPLPELPFPNDLLTRGDPQSPTRRRVNLSLSAPTLFQTEARARLDELDGFGTSAPITVRFDVPLDLVELLARQGDADPANDAVLLVDLTTGEQVQLDFGSGRFPLERMQLAPTLGFDPLAAVPNLLFPVDGPLANLVHPLDPSWASRHGGVPQASDDLLTFYERATDTLILRPLVPLAQRRTYAVVLTDRLVDGSGRAVRSPFAGINHIAQTQALSGLAERLPVGLSLAQVAFVWTFTTQSVTRELELIRQGLLGFGPLRSLSVRIPVQEGTTVTAGAESHKSRLNLYRALDLESAGQPWLLRSARMIELLSDPVLAPLLLPDATPPELQGIVESLAYVDFFVGGQFETADFLWEPDRPADSSSFQLDPSTGFSRARPANVPFLLAIPKPDPSRFREQPFPAAAVLHDEGSWRLPLLVRLAGTFARNGVASVAIDLPGAGIGLSPAQQLALVTACTARGVGNFGRALLNGRAHDLDHDGVSDPGGDTWTGDPFHTRDVLRQGAIDVLQLARLLATFDSRGYMTLPFDDGRGGVAGDFDGDQIPDLAGPAVWGYDFSGGDGRTFNKGARNPGSDLFLYGHGLGARVASITAALEPAYRAVAVDSGGGGLTDLALRGTSGAGLLDESLGPLLTTCAFDPLVQRCGGPGGVETLVWSFREAGRLRTVPIAPLSLAPGDVVTACNLTWAKVQKAGATQPSTSSGCAQTTIDATRLLRLTPCADRPDVLAITTPQELGQPDQMSVSLVRPGDAIEIVVSRATGERVVIERYEQDVVLSGLAVAAQSPLTAPGRGLGLERNTPALRRHLQLQQTALESADPVNYARHWMDSLLPARAGLAASVLVLGAPGDPVVPLSSTLAVARSAGLIERRAVDLVYAMTIDDLLLSAGAVEGVARLRRFEDGSVGPREKLGLHLACAAPGDCSGEVIADLSGLSCDPQGASCTDMLGMPRLVPPLRTQVQRVTRSDDGNAVGLLGLVFPVRSRAGAHALFGPRPGSAFDQDLFTANQIAHFFETRGRELSFEACLATLASCPWTDWSPATP